MAVALMLAQRLGWAGRIRNSAKACQGMQATLLTLTALVAVLSQWHDALRAPG